MPVLNVEGLSLVTLVHESIATSLGTFRAFLLWEILEGSNYSEERG
jgi:hypothetical protein